MIDVLFERQQQQVFDRLELIKKFQFAYFQQRIKYYWQKLIPKFNLFPKEKELTLEEQKLQEKIRLDRNLYQKYRLLFSQYEPIKYEGKVIHFQSEEWANKDFSKLQSIFPNSQFSLVNSLHNSLFLPDEIELFAKKLNQYL